MHHFYSLNWYTEANKIHLNVHQAAHYRRLGLVMSICTLIHINRYRTNSYNKTQTPVLYTSHQARKTFSFMFSQNSCNFRTNTNFCHRQYIVNKIYFHSDNKLTACSKCLVAKSLFLVCAKRRFPNCKCVREIISGGGFMLKTD